MVAPGDTVSTMVVRAMLEVKQLNVACLEVLRPLSNSLIHSFSAKRDVLISKLSVLL